MGGAKTKTTCFRVNILCRRNKGYFEPCKATLVEFWDQKYGLLFLFKSYFLSH